MKRVTGIGGIFFKCTNPTEVKSWYSKHLGLNTDEYGTSFEWRKAENPNEKGYTAWSPMDEKTDYFAPSEQSFMVNFRVENLEALIAVLKEEGVQVIGEIQSYEYGKFAHIMDPEGNKVELWEPVDEEYDKVADKKTF
ncbi:VOC family protein [Limibacter armeniacum]|uniref:VOC family protein n=1 Tax=Limibacter armeniacum TaxID=466084 RepID=UPI002FE62CF2